ncbi:uncharacterized protein LOC124256538 isoform X2 [Haliotis rubra]|uniref:uncharacterized protein LOC124256538 isoform X2 n=1 Tax=Haliotis rubra TaxID=36100 RepID=UPI001EE5FCE2|nr:uncharacterized protein LOC124256538 isoform X2 [Haliotis rubra]
MSGSGAATTLVSSRSGTPKEGPRPYHGDSHSGQLAGSIHDHPDQYRTMGLGELDVVLNGIDFRTRHNDYKLQMPGNKKIMNAVRDVPFPPIPDAITRLNTTDEQAAEMREWFSAWQNQNETHRPYKDHFTPVLCYLEGFMMNDLQKLYEPSETNVHHFDALTHDEMLQKIRFSGYSGIQSSSQDLAYLPRYVMNVVNGTIDPAQWNYRVACHPLSEDLPLKNLKLVDDLNVRMANNMTVDDYRDSPGARFDLNDKTDDQSFVYGLLDKVMQEIPGKDNYGGLNHDILFTQNIFEIKFANYTPLNTAYYTRWYKSDDSGAMGLRIIHRGFADSYCFIAQTTLPEAASMTLTYCHKNRTTHKMGCEHVTRQYSYAIPLEIVYLTPLHNWNPYSIQYKGDYSTDYAKSVTANNRQGGMTQATAFDGSNSMHWYHTPEQFFDTAALDKDNQAHRVVGVLDSKGTPRKVMASGMRTILPEIPGIGSVRTRYPILPVHGEGLSVWKELDALKDITMKIQANAAAFEKNPVHVDEASVIDKPQPSVHFLVGPSDQAHGNHTHSITLTFAQMESLGAGQTVSVTTSFNSGHSHQVEIYVKTGPGQHSDEELRWPHWSLF